jgi:hypothetical protein
VVNQLKNKLDLPRFLALDSEFGGVATAQQLQSQTESFLSSVFEDPQLLNS